VILNLQNTTKGKAMNTQIHQQQIQTVGSTHTGSSGDVCKPVSMLETAAAAKKLQRFIMPSQLSMIGDMCRGEERDFFKNKVLELSDTVNSMPVTYETDGQGDQAMAHLHYFSRDCDWYITERDQEEEQLQAFGLACIWEEELGYISIQELIEAGAELDLYWTPKTLSQIKAERQMQDVNYTGHPMHY
jgi:hypothetical protein